MKIEVRQCRFSDGTTMFLHEQGSGAAWLVEPLEGNNGLQKRCPPLHLPALSAELTVLTREQTFFIVVFIGNTGHSDCLRAMPGLLGINGFGRIGMLVFRAASANPDVQRPLHPSRLHGLPTRVTGGSTEPSRCLKRIAFRPY